MSIIKYYTNPAYDSGGNPTTVNLNLKDMYKTAGYEEYDEELRLFIANIKPKDNHAYLLIAAMGDQNWGPNKNSDYWPTEALSHCGDDYGYKTFEKGHWFHHHRNKSLDDSYGDILKAVWNNRMGRIELIVEADLNKDKELQEALDKGLTIETSMGSRVKMDCCKICHPRWQEFYKIPEEDMVIISKETDLNKIKEIGKKHGVDLSYITSVNPDGGPVGIHSNTSKYCDHMKRTRNQVLSSGQQVCVVNLRPSFFDISKVGVNADKSSFVLAKVASQQDEYQNEDIADEAPEKISAIKVGDQVHSEGDNNIEKEVEGTTVADNYDDIQKYYMENICPEMYKKEPEIPDDVIDNIGQKYGLPEILSSFLSMGMFPHPREFQRIVIIQMGKKPEQEEYDRKGIYLRPCDVHEKMREIDHEKYEDMIGIGPDKVNDDLLDVLKHFFWERSNFRRPLVKRMTIIKKAESVNPYIDESMGASNRSILPALLGSIGVIYAASAIEASRKLKDILPNVKPKHVGAAILATILANSIIKSKQADARMQYQQQQMGKTASHPAWTLAKWVGPTLGVYTLGGHVINKAQRGEETSGAGRFVARNPVKASIGATILANKGPRNLIWDMIRGSAKAVTKKAELGMDMSQINIDDYPIEERDLAGIAVWESIK